VHFVFAESSIVSNMVGGQLSEAGAPRRFSVPLGGYGYVSETVNSATAFVAKIIWP
jgi:hypothetical protein